MDWPRVDTGHVYGGNTLDRALLACLYVVSKNDLGGDWAGIVTIPVGPGLDRERIFGL
jgi:hypothetical protein